MTFLKTILLLGCLIDWGIVLSDLIASWCLGQATFGWAIKRQAFFH